MALSAQEKVDLLKQCESQKAQLKNELQRCELGKSTHIGHSAFPGVTDRPNENSQEDEMPPWLRDAAEKLAAEKLDRPNENSQEDEMPPWLRDAEEHLKKLPRGKLATGKLATGKLATGKLTASTAAPRPSVGKRPVTLLKDVLLCHRCAELDRHAATGCKRHNTASKSITCGEFWSDFPKYQRKRL